jgi:hypothetical protein
MKHLVLFAVMLAGFVAGPAPRAWDAVDAGRSSVRLAQLEEHEDPAGGIDERPLVNLAFPVIMIVGGLLYLAVTRRRTSGR